MTTDSPARTYMSEPDIVGVSRRTVHWRIQTYMLRACSRSDRRHSHSSHVATPIWLPPSTTNKGARLATGAGSRREASSRVSPTVTASAKHSSAVSAALTTTSVARTQRVTGIGLGSSMRDDSLCPLSPDLWRRHWKPGPHYCSRPFTMPLALEKSILPAYFSLSTFMQRPMSRKPSAPIEAVFAYTSVIVERERRGA